MSFQTLNFEKEDDNNLHAFIPTENPQTLTKQ
jgi:hypothetical protein